MGLGGRGAGQLLGEFVDLLGLRLDLFLVLGFLLGLLGEHVEEVEAGLLGGLEGLVALFGQGFDCLV